MFGVVFKMTHFKNNLNNKDNLIIIIFNLINISSFAKRDNELKFPKLRTNSSQQNRIEYPKEKIKKQNVQLLKAKKS